MVISEGKAPIGMGTPFPPVIISIISSQSLLINPNTTNWVISSILTKMQKLFEIIVYDLCNYILNLTEDVDTCDDEYYTDNCTYFKSNTHDSENELERYDSSTSSSSFNLVDTLDISDLNTCESSSESEIDKLEYKQNDILCLPSSDPYVKELRIYAE